MLMPVTTRSMAMPTAAATPMHSETSMTVRLICPPETSSTWALSTQTAGSAQTASAPRTTPARIRK